MTTRHEICIFKTEKQANNNERILEEMEQKKASTIAHLYTVNYKLAFSIGTCRLPLQG